MQKIKLNDLDYNVLAVLHTRELSGYDITQALKHFRQTSHSRIYPSLAKLESFDYVVHRDVAQVGKPDKKLYTVTDKGKELLVEWVADKQNMKSPKIRNDEFVWLQCLHLLNNEHLIEQLEYKKAQIEKLSHGFLASLMRAGDEKTRLHSYFMQILQVSTQSDTLIIDWINSNLKKNADKPKQSLREYLKENL